MCEAHRALYVRYIRTHHYYYYYYTIVEVHCMSYHPFPIVIINLKNNKSLLTQLKSVLHVNETSFDSPTLFTFLIIDDKLN